MHPGDTRLAQLLGRLDRQQTVQSVAHDQAETDACVCARPPRAAARAGGDGFTLLADQEVALASKGDARLGMGLRRIQLRRHEGGA